MEPARHGGDGQVVNTADEPAEQESGQNHAEPSGDGNGAEHGGEEALLGGKQDHGTNMSSTFVMHHRTHFECSISMPTLDGFDWFCRNTPNNTPKVNVSSLKSLRRPPTQLTCLTAIQRGLRRLRRPRVMLRGLMSKPMGLRKLRRALWLPHQLVLS